MNDERPEPLPDLEPHRHRDVAESFGLDPGRYDRTRPRYPDAMIDRIVSSIAGRDVLDVGCGTGIAARQFGSAGCRVLGVDIDPRMADVARDHGTEVEVAAFETWERHGRLFHAVVSGQSWHWIDPVVGAQRAVEAIRPGGRLAVFWNVFQPPGDLADAFTAVYRRVLPERPGNDVKASMDAYSVMFATAADGMGTIGAFSEPEQWRYDWDHSYTRSEWLDQVPTFGGHNKLSPTQLQELLDGIGDAIDHQGGNFTMHYATVAVTAQRTG